MSAMTATSLAVEAPGDGFEHWLIARSFSMLAPMSRLGLAAVLGMLLVVDPSLLLLGFWPADRLHGALVAWHTCAALHFLGFQAAARRVKGHAGRLRLLVAFFLANAWLFCWFGLMSWLLSGDLSTYAIFLLSMACVFTCPGQARTWVNLASAALLVALILCIDGRGIFHTSEAAINLLALHAVALLIDRFLMGLHRALYDEQCRVDMERARADRVLYNALPVAIANELKQHNMVKAEKFERMTVLFVDIAGFTRFSATLAPDAVVGVLNAIFSEFDALVDGRDVEKIKTIGDAYMVVGKGPPAAIAELALDMLDAMQAYNQRSGHSLAIRCGMHVGSTVAGVIGLRRFLYDVWGDAVNLASRMETTGVAGRVHASEDIYRALAGQFDFEARGLTEVRGKGALRTYFLTARSPALPAMPSGARTWAGGSSGTPSGRPESCGFAG